jgi:transcription initiation factor TFIID subunit 10
LVSLATQKFISDICTDSMQYCKIRQEGKLKDNQSSNSNKEKKLVFTTDDLSQSLKEYGINIEKPEYFKNDE